MRIQTKIQLRDALLRTFKAIRTFKREHPEVQKGLDWIAKTGQIVWTLPTFFSDPKPLLDVLGLGRINGSPPIRPIMCGTTWLTTPHTIRQIQAVGHDTPVATVTESPCKFTPSFWPEFGCIVTPEFQNRDATVDELLDFVKAHREFIEPCDDVRDRRVGFISLRHAKDGRSLVIQASLPTILGRQNGDPPSDPARVRELQDLRDELLTQLKDRDWRRFLEVCPKVEEGYEIPLNEGGSYTRIVSMHGEKFIEHCFEDRILERERLIFTAQVVGHVAHQPPLPHVVDENATEEDLAAYEFGQVHNVDFSDTEVQADITRLSSTLWHSAPNVSAVFFPQTNKRSVEEMQKAG